MIFINIGQIIPALKVGAETEQQLIREINKNPGKIQKLAETAYEGQNFQFPLCNISPLERLATVAWLLQGAYERYRKKKIPECIIFSTFQDVGLRAEQFYQKTGEHGISKEDVIWFRHIMNASIFQMGVLQFQLFRMVYTEYLGEDAIIYQKGIQEEIPEGTPVINIHIPAGTSLQKEQVEEAMERARVFFQTCFPDMELTVFLCCSWLLFPPMIEQLPLSSRIREFAGEFTVVGTSAYREQAMENLFPGKKKDGFPKEKTFLQKLALEKPECFGFGFGIKK